MAILTNAEICTQEWALAWQIFEICPSVLGLDGGEQRNFEKSQRDNTCLNCHLWEPQKEKRNTYWISSVGRKVLRQKLKMCWLLLTAFDKVLRYWDELRKELTGK